MSDWLKNTARQVLLMDGGMGTQLADAGMPGGDNPEQWARDHSVELLEIHERYVKAGADVILTCTFGGSPFKLAAAGLDGQTEAINWALGRVARAAHEKGIVLGDIGPCGELIEPYGNRTKSEIEQGFRRQVMGLADIVDGFIIETMSDLEEASLALKAVKKIAPDKPVLVSLTYQKDADGANFHTIMGQDPAMAAVRLDAEGADAIGTNCGTGIEDMIRIVEALAAKTSRPIFAEPNAGLPKLVGGQTVYDQTPQAMAAQVHKLVQAGARMVGGCCGTTPSHIKAIRAAIDEINSAAQ